MKQLSDEWNLLGTNYYRRLSLYNLSLSETLNLENFFIAIGGCGGLIAFLERPKQTGKCLLLITSASGQTFAETLVSFLLIFEAPLQSFLVERCAARCGILVRFI